GGESTMVSSPHRIQGVFSRLHINSCAARCICASVWIFSTWPLMFCRPSWEQQVPEAVGIFLSTVSNEFGDYRDQLRSKVTRHNVQASCCGTLLGLHLHKPQQSHFRNLFPGNPRFAGKSTVT